MKLRVSFLPAAMLILSSCLHRQAPVVEAAAPQVPEWVTNLEQAYPEREWLAVNAEGSNQPQAEAAAMNALARIFRTDVASISQASQQFSQIISSAGPIRDVDFQQSQNFSQDVITSTNVRGLIGVQIDVYRVSDRTFYVNARMNRGECAARYTAMIRENTAIINRLLASAGRNGTFDAYARLSFAYAIAQPTDAFQNILEILDPSASSRRPGYGGANAIRAAMIECAGLITIGVSVNTEDANDMTLFTRAAGTFFRDRGFRINEQGQGRYVLQVNARFEALSQTVISCRYYFDAALADQNRAFFTFTEDNRSSHPNSISEARRLAGRAVETSLKEGGFAQEFDSWLISLLD